MQEYLDLSSAAPAPRTLIDILRETTARHPQASALEDADGALSYAELLAHVGRTAARLHSRGVRRGDRVGVRMPSGSRDLYVAILGIMAAGAAYVPVDADDPPERAELVFREAGVKGVITGSGVFQDADPTTALSDVDDLFVGDAPHPSSRAIPAVPPPTVGRRRVDHLHLRVHGRAEGCRRHSPIGRGVRRCRGAAVPAVRAPRAG